MLSETEVIIADYYMRYTLYDIDETIFGDEKTAGLMINIIYNKNK